VVIPVDTGIPNKSLFSYPSPSAQQVGLAIAYDAARLRAFPMGGSSAPSEFPRITSPIEGHGPSAPLPSVSVPKRSKFVRLARKWPWLKHEGGYLDVIPYYFAAPEDEDSLRRSLDNCQHTWLQERKGDDLRYRSVGCGHRLVCPPCGTYKQLVLANEAVESMFLAQEALERVGVGLECYGFKMVKTMPKHLSESIDLLLSTDTGAWWKELNKLWAASSEFNRLWFGEGVGSTSAFHPTGESAPDEPHYHLDEYIFPAVLQGGKWKALSHWTPKSRFKAMREAWAGCLNRVFGLDLKEADISCNYLGSIGRLNHCLHYLYRPLLSDLWAGWGGVEDGEVVYKYGKGRKKEKLLSVDDMAKISCRVRAIPKHFKRIRHFGPFSDGQRGKTMLALGLEPVIVVDDGELGEKWELTGVKCHFVRYVAEGVVLREVLGINEECDFDEEGWPIWRWKHGPEFLVKDEAADYRPSGVSIGRRKRWRVPGAVKAVEDG